MAISVLPASPSLTWQHNLNQTQAQSGALQADEQNVLYKIKTSFIGFGTNPWTVLGSSDSSTAGLDSTDRISAANKLVFAAASSPHSWIVLKQTGLATNYQLLITCENSNQTLTFYVSVNAGFTGGSTTLRPTATDECNIAPAGASNFGWLGGNTIATSQWIVNAQQSTDGSFTRIFVFNNNSAVVYWHIAKLANIDTGVTYGIDHLILGGTLGSDAPTYSNLIVNSAGKGRARPVAGNVATRLSVLGSGSGMQTEGQNFVAASIYSSKWVALAPWVTDVTNQAFLGSLPDTYIGSSTRVSADAYPSGGTKVWQHVGNLIVPSGGTAFTKA